MRTSISLAAVAAISLALAGCGSDSNAPDTSHVGPYDMLSVAGQPLPVTLMDMPGYKLEVTDGGLTLNANNTFAESVTTVETVDGATGPAQVDVCNGRYTRKGSIITLTTPETDTCAAQQVTGTLSGTRLSVDYEGTVIVFTRQR